MKLTLYIVILVGWLSVVVFVSHFLLNSLRF
jgi:hypothetical protein